MICRHFDRPHYARGLCRGCYTTQCTNRNLDAFPRQNRTSVALAERAERVRAELEAAGPYASAPPTWRGVAEVLGVKYKTLDRARTRARRYRERETA